uniref:RNA-directed RNA polymerase n=1 Tax=Mucor hiemalis virus 2 TaxID=2805802 RepID=A0A8J9WYR0_9VIRU|nr:RNA dependent RNA polymerase [Mucor hiemalis virus 2]
MHPLAVERAKSLGSLGSFLLRHLPDKVDVDPTDLITCWSIIDKISKTDALAAVSMSILNTMYPLQVPLTKSTILKIVYGAYSLDPLSPLTTTLPPSELNQPLTRRVMYYDNLDNDSTIHLFPAKSAGPAHTKTNVWFTDAWYDLKRTNPVLAKNFNAHGRLMVGFYNDQATSALLYASALCDHTPLAVPIAIASIRNHSIAKNLSNLFKAVGANSSLLGSLFTEAQVLQGRGVGRLNLYDSAAERCDITRLDGQLFIPQDYDKLRTIIDEIISTELQGETPVYPTDDEFWTSRWLWCVNGSHNKSLDKHLGYEDMLPMLPRAHRKAYSEAVSTYDLDAWQAHSAFSISEKMEHGKTRAIYGGDTQSYYAFERLLRPIEEVWKGRQVILNPGRGGTLYNAVRLRKISATAPINLMMDYDDFNASHTIKSQQLVIEALCNAVAYPKDRADKLVASFSNSSLYAEGKYVGKLQGTLMSGHRATTVCNSILNRAYLLYIHPELRNYACMHVGDDVYFALPSFSHAAAVLQDIRRSSIRMNPTKQSCGVITAEFLRMALGCNGAQGYAPRTIASIVSGNWVSLYKLNPEEGISSLVASAWGLQNRSGSTRATLLLAHALSRYAKLPYADLQNLLTGVTALNNGPTRAGAHIVHRLDVLPADDATDRLHNNIVQSLPHNASSQYLSNHVSQFELVVLQEVGTSPLEVMVESSFSKSLAQETNPACVAVTKSLCETRGSKSSAVNAVELLSQPSIGGELTRYPIAGLYRNLLSTKKLRKLLRWLEIPVPDGLTPEIVAWGATACNTIITGILPYSDACSLSAKTFSRCIYTPINVCF